MYFGGPDPLQSGDVAQLVERFHGMEEVLGSNPCISTTPPITHHQSRRAQLNQTNQPNQPNKMSRWNSSHPRIFNFSLSRGALCLLALVLSCFTPEVSRASEWEKVSEDRGITTFRKEIPGSPIVAFKGEAEIGASIPRIIGVLEAIQRENEWMAGVVESHNIEQRTESDRFEYNRTETPWPLQDRDFVIHTRTTLERTPVPTVRIQMNSEPHSKKPHQPGVVRAELIDSSFTLRQITPLRTLFTCEIQADPKGVIPKWAVNLFQRSWPFRTISGLRQQLFKPDIQENQTLIRLLSFPH